jgi:hypothetical protein
MNGFLAHCRKIKLSGVEGTFEHVKKNIISRLQVHLEW